MKKEDHLPEWVCALEKKAENLALSWNRFSEPYFPDRVATPEEFGFEREKDKKATEAIQKALDHLAACGGGSVLLKEGDYISGTIELRSHVQLRVEEGARLLGSFDLEDYPAHVAKRRTVMDTHMGMHQSLIVAEGCENIGICGRGVIDGRGDREHFPGEETVGGTPGRPFLLRVIDCKGVIVKDITLRNAACWMQNYLNCEGLILDHVTVENLVNYNNDGIDIDGCRNVLVRDSYVNSGDDALCFKGAAQAVSENIYVRDCVFVSSCNAIKFGTDTQGVFRNILIEHCKAYGADEKRKKSTVKEAGADSGISLEMLDGGILEDVVIRDIEMKKVRSPFFARLDDRGRVKPEEAKPEPGSLKNILIERITGEDCGPMGSYMLGIPEKDIGDIVIRHVLIRQKASTLPVVGENEIGEMYGVYPDAHMIRGYGDAPAYGMWARHVKRLYLMDYQVMPDGEELRPEIVGECCVLRTSKE